MLEAGPGRLHGIRQGEVMDVLADEFRGEEGLGFDGLGRLLSRKRGAGSRLVSGSAGTGLLNGKSERELPVRKLGRLAGQRFLTFGKLGRLTPGSGAAKGKVGNVNSESEMASPRLGNVN